MDPHRSVFRNQWPASSYAPARFPSPVYGTPPIVYSSVGSTIPIGVSFSSRSLASSRDLPPSPTYPHRRGRYEDAFSSTSYTSTTSSSSRYGLSPSTRGVDPYDISIGGSSTSCSHSSKLSRRIDSFLKTSEQTIERVSRRRGSGSSWMTCPDSPDLSLSLSGRAYRSTSAASIAVKAKKHLSALNDSANKTTGAGCSTSDSLDDLDSDSDEGLNEVSDDTSADLSKLDDLSSDSDDDEFFDVVPLGHRSFEGNLPLKVPDSKAPVQQAHENSSLPPADTQVGSPGMGNVLGGGNAVVAAASVSSVAAPTVASSTAPSIASAAPSIATAGDSTTICIFSPTVTSVISDINTATSVSVIAACASRDTCTTAVPSTVSSDATLAAASRISSAYSVSSIITSESATTSSSVASAFATTRSITTKASTTTDSIVTSPSATTSSSVASAFATTRSITTKAPTTTNSIVTSPSATTSSSVASAFATTRSITTKASTTTNSVVTSPSAITSSIATSPSATTSSSVASAFATTRSITKASTTTNSIATSPSAITSSIAASTSSVAATGISLSTVTVSVASLASTFSSVTSTVSSITTVSAVSNVKLSSTTVSSVISPSSPTSVVISSTTLNGSTPCSSTSSMASPGTSLITKSPQVGTPSFSDGPATPSPSLKKYQAPLPPGSLSRQASSASLARSSGAPEVPLSRQLSSASIARHSINNTEEGKKCQRAPSFKKYPAPTPPGLVRGNSSASVNSTTDASKSFLSNDTNHKKMQNAGDTVVQLPNGDVHSNISSDQTGENLPADLPALNASISNPTKITNGHVEDILSAFQRGASESMQQLKATASTKNDTVDNPTENPKPLSNGSSLEHSSSRDVSLDNSAADDEKSKPSKRDPGAKKSTRKLGSLTSKFETNSESTTEVKNAPSSPTEMKSRKFSVKAPQKNKLGSLASKFEASDSLSGKDSKPAALKLQSPYTDLVHLIPPSVPPPVVQRKSIGGINVSKFGGTGKFPTQLQLRKTTKTNSEESEPRSFNKVEEQALGNEVVSPCVADAETNMIDDLNDKSQTDETVTRDAEKTEPENKAKEVLMETANASVASTATPGSPIAVSDTEKVPKADNECVSGKDSLKNATSPELAIKTSISTFHPTTVELSTGSSFSGDLTSPRDPSTISSVSSVFSSAKISCTSTITSSSTQSAISDITSTKPKTLLISANVSPSLASCAATDPAVSVARISGSSPSSATASDSIAVDTSSSATVEGKLVLFPAGSPAPASVKKTDEPGGDIPFVSTGARPKLKMPTSLMDTETVSYNNELSKSNYKSEAISGEFQSSTLKSSIPLFSKYGLNSIPSGNDSTEVLSQSIALPSASIFTRASSVSPSISISRAEENGLNACLSDEIFSRARSLTPLEGTGERRSLRPRSKYLQSGSDTSPLDLGRHESALEKYRRRKEMRNIAAKAKLEALTKQTKDISLSDSTLLGDSSPPVRSSEKISSNENSKFKIDLSSIKDFLKKTEEEISKLPRYIREPWAVTEFLSGSKNSGSSTTSSTADTTADQSITSTNASVDVTKSPSDDIEVTNAQLRRSSEGDVEVYVDARERIDTSQLDTLMPLPDPQSLERRCRSVTPSRVIANTEKILSQTDRLLKKSRSGNSLRKSYSRSICAANVERLAEVVADLAEEHSTAQLAGERLEAEQADRMRLEKELDTVQGDMRELSIARERLEHEKSVLRVEMLQHASSLNNGDINEADDASSASLYKRKYEWSQREVETLKQQLRQHQQDEAEQTALLKKQLEKKINDAREETEEQRQVAGQLKKRTQRLQAEMNDLKILLEEQAARNSLLEKKQRKFDSELAAGQDELRLERLNKDKVMRERDAHLAEKYAVDQELSTLKMELELRDERVAALTRQLDELSVAGHGDHEITQLRKVKHDLETKLKDQEEELDELAGQVQMLEAARTRLEMSHEQMRKEHKKEVQQREEEVEEVRIAAQKKVKALEAQVEAEHEERTQLVREKHELERRMLELMDRSSVAPDDDTVHRLKKDLRKTKALLKDTQTMLEKSQSEGPSKLIIRQLKTQLEDCEFAKTAALKARQSADADLAEMQTALDDSQRSRKEAEDRASRFLKEKSELQTQLEENEELHAETLKKYKSTVSQISVDQITLSEQSQRIAELEQEKQLLSERLLELNSKVEVLEGETANIHTQRMLQMKVKELESKLELELATKKRIESQVTRLKEQLERVCGECDMLKVKETQGVEQSRKVGRQLRQAKEEAALFEQRNTELNSKKQELEKQMEIMESEISTLKSDLKLAFKRIEDLQMALQGDISDSDSDLSDSDTDSDTSLTSYLTSRATRSTSATATAAAGAVTPPAAPVASAQPNAIDSAPAGRGEDLMSPGSDAMAMIEEAREEDQNSESFA